MAHRKRLWTPILVSIFMLLLILDTKTALSGAKEGIDMCLQAVIPSLFPFFVLSSMITNSVVGKKFSILLPIGKLCGIPKGAESLLIIGILGGYPVGAQAIADAYKHGQLKKASAHRLLGFCSNAGPSFLFGMISPLFTSRMIPWVLWFVHILSALIVGTILPQKSNDACLLRKSDLLTASRALEQSVRTIGNVCGWVVVFRIVIAILNRWILWFLPTEGQVLLNGFLELSNGCLSLRSLPNEGTRFVLCACMLAIGGLCVGMQTVSVTGSLGTGQYFPGKLMQCIISFLICSALQPILFSHTDRVNIPSVVYACIFAAGCVMLFKLHRKKVVALSAQI